MKFGTFFPLLKQELLAHNMSQDYFTLTFYNHSVLDVVSTGTSQRGGRRHGGLIEEVATINGDELSAVVLPLMNVNRRDHSGPSQFRASRIRRKYTLQLPEPKLPMPMNGSLNLRLCRFSNQKVLLYGAVVTTYRFTMNCSTATTSTKFVSLARIRKRTSRASTCPFGPVGLKTVGLILSV